MLHEAPSSVLVARPARDPDTWPQAIVVGVDGSAESELAVAAARLVADARGADLGVMSATSDQVDREVARRVAPEVEERDGRAFGSPQSRVRDRRSGRRRQPRTAGVKSLGSVSERIVHQASCRCWSCVTRPPPDRLAR